MLVQLIMTGLAVLVVDRVGRRPLLLGGVSGMVSIFTFLRVSLIVSHNVESIYLLG